MPRKEYVGLSLPKTLIKAIKAEIERPNSLYASVTDFVKEAIREKLGERSKRGKHSYSVHSRKS